MTSKCGAEDRDARIYSSSKDWQFQNDSPRYVEKGFFPTWPYNQERYGEPMETGSHRNTKGKASEKTFLQNMVNPIKRILRNSPYTLLSTKHRTGRSEPMQIN